MVAQGGPIGEKMIAVPTLETARLRLRPFAASDAPTVAELAGDARVAAPTLNIPHPYPPELARTWIAGLAEAAAAGRVYAFAITERAGEAVIGAITIRPDVFERAEIGYWLGVPSWGRGYTSEAAQRVTAFGFEALRFHRIQATCLPRNPASVRVLEHVGMRREGLLRGYVRKDGVYEDLLMYAILRDEWKEQSAVGSRQSAERGR
jgi:ribosomal-protein-alanine N-acetyltransferase